MTLNTARWAHPFPEGTDVADVPADMQALAESCDEFAKDDQGTFANRPVSTPGSPGEAGRYYWATDQKILYRDFGTGWEPIPVQVTSAQIADEAVTSAKIANNTIQSADIAGNAITAPQIAADAVGTSEIADGNVTTAKLADGAVTEAKIGTGAVTESKIVVPTCVIRGTTNITGNGIYPFDAAIVDVGGASSMADLANDRIIVQDDGVFVVSAVFAIDDTSPGGTNSSAMVELQGRSNGLFRVLGRGELADQSGGALARLVPALSVTVPCEPSPSANADRFDLFRVDIEDFSGTSLAITRAMLSVAWVGPRS